MTREGTPGSWETLVSTLQMAKGLEVEDLGVWVEGKDVPAGCYGIFSDCNFWTQDLCPNGLTLSSVCLPAGKPLGSTGEHAPAGPAEAVPVYDRAGTAERGRLVRVLLIVAS